MAEITEKRANNSTFEAVKRSRVLLAARRLSKSCYSRAASKQILDIPSLSFTEVGVGIIANTVEHNSRDSHQKLDMQYASKISHTIGISPCSLMLALIYIERVRLKEPEYLRQVSSCDVFVVSLMIASKFLFDDGEEEEVFNEEWAQRANIDIKKLNKLEREFLCAIDWNIFVEPDLFFDLFSFIEVTAVQNECRRRYWKGLNYGELILLLDYSSLSSKLKVEFIDCVVKVVVLCTVTYVAMIVCIAASVVTISTCHHLVTKQPLTMNQLTNSSIVNERMPVLPLCESFTTSESKVGDETEFLSTKSYLITHLSSLTCSQNFILWQY